MVEWVAFATVLPTYPLRLSFPAGLLSGYERRNIEAIQGDAEDVKGETIHDGTLSGSANLDFRASVVGDRGRLHGTGFEVLNIVACLGLPNRSLPTHSPLPDCKKQVDIPNNWEGPTAGSAQRTYSLLISAWRLDTNTIYD